MIALGIVIVAGEAALGRFATTGRDMRGYYIAN